MEMQIGYTDYGLKLPWKKAEVGVSFANALMISVKQGFVVHQFVMETTVSFGFEGTLGVAMAVTNWFRDR